VSPQAQLLLGGFIAGLGAGALLLIIAAFGWSRG
jgi:hypothetical protein